VSAFFDTSSSKKKRARGRRRGFVARTLKFLFTAALLSVVTVAATITGLYLFTVRGYEDQLAQRYPTLPQNSHVYDRNGEEISWIIGRENRETVDYEGLGENLPQAVIAVEDKRFQDHAGVDFEGVGRAAYADLQAWEILEGGSTITEQLMKNLYVDENERAEASFWRRFKQSSLAFSYERRHSKKEVLTAYLNTVYFGDGAHGAEMAAQRYFDKSAKDLSISEAAALAGFLRAPSTYLSDATLDDGSGASGRAEDRRNEVLGLMEGQGMISASERLQAQGEPLRFAPDPPPDNEIYEPFLDKVRREVENELGPQALEQGGLRIETTVDTEMLQQAVEETENKLSQPGDPAASIVSVEPQSGAIRVLVGQSGGFNLALDARRQPGSSFKALVLATAMKKGLSAETTYVSQELNIRFQGEDFTISNYDYIERGPITIREALAESDNTVFVQLAVELGLENVVGTAKAMGVTSPLEPYPSTAIGGLGTGVSPLEMASSYGTFAGGGVHREAYAVERVEHLDYGRTEATYDRPVVGRRVLSGDQAAMATDVLRGVVTDGTASRFHDLDEEIGRPSAGKTGTTDDYADAWYVGFTNRLSTAVWVGYPDARRSMRGVHGLEAVSGENLPLDLWSAYMARATEDAPVSDFPEVSPDEPGQPRRSTPRNFPEGRIDTATASSDSEDTSGF